MTVNEVAEYLRMNPMTIYRLAQQGMIPASKILGCWRFQRSEIEQWLKSQEYQPSKVLVIDDEPTVGKMIQNVLGRNNTIIVAENAQYALTILQREKFNLIFLDLKLPDMDGLALFKKIKEFESTIPVIVITGANDPRLIGNVVLEGAKFVLNKPFTMEEVQQMLSFIKV